MKWSVCLDDKIDEVIRLVQQGVTHREIARRLGIAPSTVHRRLVRAKKLQEVKSGPIELPEFERWDTLADSPRPTVQQDDGIEGLLFDMGEEEPVEKLIQRQTDNYFRQKRRAEQGRITPIRVRDGLPIGICHLGDPHLDDDGCNFPELLRTLETIAKTEGMHASCLGDLANNWVGRLQALYAHQQATQHDAVRLIRWFVKAVPYVYLVLGNHDHWNQSAHLIRAMLSGVKIPSVVDHQANIEIDFGPGTDPIRLVARHSFRGMSQWNRAHGPMKALKMNPWAQIAIMGHIHIHALHHETSTDGRVTNAIVVRGYKEIDHYADQLGLAPDPYGHSATTILDPKAPPTERVQVVWDVEEAADRLAWARQRRR